MPVTSLTRLATAFLNGLLVAFTTLLALPVTAAATQLTGATKIAGTLTGDTTCVVMTDQTVKCWGDDQYGQAGTGARLPHTSFLSQVVQNPRTVAGLTQVTQLAGGDKNFCAVHSGGAVACWGRYALAWNVSLPDDTPSEATSSSVPQRIQGITDAIMVSVSVVHACALTRSGDVKCWGSDYAGRLGAAANDRPVASNKPVRVANVSNAVALSTFFYGGCAASGSGATSCWGDLFTKSDGSLVQPTVHDGATPVANLGDVVEISADPYRLCALSSQGNVSCYGSVNVLPTSHASRLWLASSNPAPVAVTRIGLPAPASRLLPLASGQTCVIDVAGDYRCWSGNAFERAAGFPTRSSQYAFNHIYTGDFVTAQLPEKVTDVAQHGGCAITATTRVVCWSIGALAGGQGYSPPLGFPGHTLLYPHYVLERGVQATVRVLRDVPPPNSYPPGTTVPTPNLWGISITGLAPTGTVSLIVGGRTACVEKPLPATVNDPFVSPNVRNAWCEIDNSDLPVGEHLIQATYSGDANNNPAQSEPSSFSVSVPPNLIREAIEFKNAEFNYYFLTAEPTEIQLLDGFPGWARSGVSFKVYTSPVAGTMPLHRFYFDQAARERQRGTHFYTADPAEIALLRSLNPSNANVPRLPVE